ncbi:FkbM family methyltransferase [Flammeovirga pectinis]|uniref:FkbM family methyltransferase n=1 Tax=Flammeovirga pectinis TaxID=2494373 RepID=A0A3S9P228_9BACT|nr:class I SAM-dependent methyltransferase [Flammeovirga pectinis]AZQ62238.1 FkbM family methyltransferase [Flammeovirga pectinis]
MKLVQSLLQKIPFFNYLLHLNYLINKGYLYNLGWTKSLKSFSIVNNEGESIPWFTYSCIHFLSTRNLSNLNVFEFGSGNSTLWFQKRVNKIYSLEHDKSWYEKIKDQFTDNVTYIFKEVNKGYSQVINDQPIQFDLIIIDGRNRVECCKNSLSKLSNKGVIIWDNSDREKYNEGYNLLIDNGFKRIDFYGLAPSICDSSLTSIFYKEENCLGI